MKACKRMIAPILTLVLGAVLLGLGVAGVLDEFWSGMGSALLAVSIFRMVRLYRVKKDDTYREQVEIAEKDERNRFIRGQAWAWAGYLFILIAAVAVIVLRVMGQVMLSYCVCYAMCLMLILYYGAYLILQKKY